MDELQAAVLRVFVKNLNEENMKRREIAKRYINANVNKTLQMTPFSFHDYVAHLFVVTAKDPHRAITHFKDLGISTASHYPTLDTEQEYLEGAEVDKELPVSKYLSKHSFTLPCNPELTEEEIVQIERAIASYHEI